MVVNKDDKTIICTDFCEGKRHDFRLLKERRVKFHSSLQILADTGYQGLQKIHFNTELPKKI